MAKKAEASKTKSRGKGKSKAVEVKAESESETAAADTRSHDPLERLAPLTDIFGRWPAWFSSQLPEWRGLDINGIKVEEYMEDDQLIVRGEIPGVDPDEDIEVSIDNGRLSIRAEREERTEQENGGRGYRSEFRYGSFSRVLDLPEGAETDEISASYTDGILEVRVPIAEKQRSRKRISVSRESRD